MNSWTWLSDPARQSAIDSRNRAELTALQPPCRRVRRSWQDAERLDHPTQQRHEQRRPPLREEHGRRRDREQGSPLRPTARVPCVSSLHCTRSRGKWLRARHSRCSCSQRDFPRPVTRATASTDVCGRAGTRSLRRDVTGDLAVLDPFDVALRVQQVLEKCRLQLAGRGLRGRSWAGVPDGPHHRRRLRSSDQAVASLAGHRQLACA